MGMRNPQEECPDVSVCAHCGTKLPKFTPKGSWGFDGFCGPACCLHSLLTTAGMNKGLQKWDIEQGREAIRELEGK